MVRLGHGGGGWREYGSIRGRRRGCGSGCKSHHVTNAPPTPCFTPPSCIVHRALVVCNMATRRQTLAASDGTHQSTGIPMPSSSRKPTAVAPGRGYRMSMMGLPQRLPAVSNHNPRMSIFRPSSQQSLLGASQNHRVSQNTVRGDTGAFGRPSIAPTRGAPGRSMPTK